MISLTELQQSWMIGINSSTSREQLTSSLSPTTSSDFTNTVYFLAILLMTKPLTRLTIIIRLLHLLIIITRIPLPEHLLLCDTDISIHSTTMSISSAWHTLYILLQRSTLKIVITATEEMLYVTGMRSHIPVLMQRADLYL